MLHHSYRRGEPPKFTPLMLLESNGVAPKGGWDPSTIVPPSLLSQTVGGTGTGTGTGPAALPGKKKKKSKKSTIATSSDTETNDNEKRKNKVTML